MAEFYLFVSHNRVAQEKFIFPYSNYLSRKKPTASIQHLCLSEIGWLLTIRTVYAKLRQNKANGFSSVVITQHPLLMAFLLLKYVFFDVKFIHFVTGQIWVTKSWLLKKIYKNMDFFLMSHATILWPDSRPQYFFLRREGYKKPNLVCPQIGSMGGITVREDLAHNFNGETKNIAWIGRLSTDKDIELLFCIALKFMKSRKGICFHVYGIDQKQTGRGLSNIVFHGFEKNVVESMKRDNIGLLLSTSKREGFNLSILEAASIGVPCISSDIYGTREIIEETFMNKFVFPVSDVDAAVDKIKKYLELSGDQKISIQKNCVKAAQNYNTGVVVGCFWKAVGEK